MGVVLTFILLAAATLLSGLITLLVAYGFMEALFYSLGRLTCWTHPIRKA
jgi:hypothetical protein